MKKIYQISLVIIGLILIGGSYYLFNNKQKEYTKNLFYMDTYINVKIYSNEKASKIKKVFDEVENIYRNYHQLSDRYNSYDNLINIYYLNQTLEVNNQIKIDSKLADLLKYSLSAYENTNHQFNIAMGNVIDVWKKYIETKDGVPTFAELINSGNTDIKNVVLETNDQGESFYTKLAAIKLDLGGIAKGYTTEKVGNYLESIGITKYLINAGGNVKVGDHYNHDQYRIGIENPNDPNNIYKIVKIKNLSVVTSGDYQRYYIYNEKRYHHLIDPKTLFPGNYMHSVTIITKDSAYAETMSKYLFMYPIEEGQKIVDQLPDLEAIWYGLDNQVYYSKGFNKYE